MKEAKTDRVFSTCSPALIRLPFLISLYGTSRSTNPLWKATGYAFATVTVLVDGIPQRRPVIGGYGTGLADGSGYRLTPSVPVKGTQRAPKQVFVRHRPALKRGTSLLVI
jgi:hypothetical protein